MINLQITSYEAIQLDNLLNTLSVLAVDGIPDAARQDLAKGFSNNPELKAVAEKLRIELSNLVLAQSVEQARTGGQFSYFREEGDRTP